MRKIFNVICIDYAAQIIGKFQLVCTFKIYIGLIMPKKQAELHSIEILLFLGRQHFTTYYSPAILLQSICTQKYTSTQYKELLPSCVSGILYFCWWRVKSYDPVMHNTAICNCFGICLWIVLRSRSLNSKQQVGWYFLVLHTIAVDLHVKTNCT